VPEVNWSRIVFNAEAQSRGDTQSCFWHCLTPSNTLLLTWQNALYNRATNTPVSIQVEISPEGSFVYRYDLSSIRMKIQSGEWPENWTSNIAIGASNEENGQVLGSKIASSNLCETLRLCDSALKNGTLTSLAFQRLEADDCSGSDRDNDGLTIEDELFVHHTNPNCRDSDFDGISDGEEVALGTNPTSRDSDGDGLVDGSDPDPGTQTSLADADEDAIPDAYENHWFGGTNETDIVDNRDETGFSLATKIKCGINPLDSVSGEYVVLTNVLSSRKLFDAFSLDSSGGETNLIFERTFAIKRTTPWQQYFLSSSPSGAAPWCMEGAFLEWETSGGASGVVSKSPYNDTFRIPLATNDFSSSITIRVRSLCNTSVRVPNPIHLLAFTPKITIEGGKILRGESGKVFSVFFDGSQSAIKLKIDRTLRPSSSPVAPDENDMVTLNAMSGSDKDFIFVPTDNGGTIAVVRPGVYAMPSLPFFDNVAALVVLQPSVSWKCNRHGCSFDGVDYDWNRHGYIEENPYPLDSSCLRKKMVSHLGWRMES
jgi:hypothetical protein